MRLPSTLDEILLVPKAKDVPLQATEALGGRGGVAPTDYQPRH
jgi:hypothetical protein